MHITPGQVPTVKFAFGIFKRLVLSVFIGPSFIPGKVNIFPERFF